VQWLIAEIPSSRSCRNSIEPFIMNVVLIDLFYQNEEWAKLRRPGASGFVQKRLFALSKSLGNKPYLDDDRFTANDLMMTTVLRILKHSDIVTGDKRLAAYIERCTTRSAFSARSVCSSAISGSLHSWPTGYLDCRRLQGPRCLEGDKEDADDNQRRNDDLARATTLQH
jgi:glutathione S-transferase